MTLDEQIEWAERTLKEYNKIQRAHPYAQMEAVLASLRDYKNVNENRVDLHTQNIQLRQKVGELRELVAKLQQRDNVLRITNPEVVHHHHHYPPPLPYYTPHIDTSRPH